jgi:hypothetical protein
VRPADTCVLADTVFFELSKRLHVYAPSLLDVYRFAGGAVDVFMVSNGVVKTSTRYDVVCREAHLCVSSPDGRIRMLPDVLYATWSGEIRGTRVSTSPRKSFQQLRELPLWRSVFRMDKARLMRVKNGSVVATDDPSLQDSDPIAVVVEETDRMTLQVVDVRVGKHSFPFLLRRNADGDLREQILEQCDWRVRTLLSKLPELPPIVDGVMQVENGG